MHTITIFANSTKLFLISQLFIPINDIELKPGVSATKPSNKLINSTCLVVCLPRPNASDISFVLRVRLWSRLLSKVDLPTPLCPVITVILFLKIFLSESLFYLFLNPF